MALTEPQLYGYAALLILDHAQDVEHLTIHEMAEGRLPGDEIEDGDARKVAGLISEAIVTVTWKELPYGYYDNTTPKADETDETDETEDV